MDYESFKNWATEFNLWKETVAGLVIVFGIVCGFLKYICRFLFIVTSVLVRFIYDFYCIINRSSPLVWKKDYQLLESKYQDVLLAQQAERESFKKQDYINQEKIAYYEMVEMQDGILYFGGESVCSRCFDVSPALDRIKVRLLSSDPENPGAYYCPSCKTHFTTTEAALKLRGKHRAAARALSLNSGYNRKRF